MEGDCHHALALLRPRLISIHALRMEGDELIYKILYYEAKISIHALRMEGDAGGVDRVPGGGQISIHALRMEGDDRAFGGLHSTGISIHALRMEGDCILSCFYCP